MGAGWSFAGYAAHGLAGAQPLMLPDDVALEFALYRVEQEELAMRKHILEFLHIALLDLGLTHLAVVDSLCGLLILEVGGIVGLGYAVLHHAHIVIDLSRLPGHLLVEREKIVLLLAGHIQLLGEVGALVLAQLVHPLTAVALRLVLRRRHGSQSH